jgi:acyl carrier protein
MRVATLRDTAEDKKTAADISSWLIDYLASQLKVDSKQIDVNRQFDEYGFDSAAAMQLVGELEDYLGRQLSPSLPYQYPSVAALSAVLAELA